MLSSRGVTDNILVVLVLVVAAIAVAQAIVPEPQFSGQGLGLLRTLPYGISSGAPRGGNVCGNGILEAGETCDCGFDRECQTRDDRSTATCANINRGFDDGTLYCNITCTQFDVSHCRIIDYSVCGDDLIEGIEECDCGNDGECGTNDDQLNGRSCQTEGFESGTLTCATNCQSVDTGRCY